MLVWSILLYAFSAFAAGFSTNIWQFLFFRCTTFIGVCVEFVAAVAWLAELFPDPKQRERVLGYTQAFSSIGGVLVTAANCLDPHARRVAAGDLRRPRGVALHADVGRHSGAAADHHPSVPAGVAGLAAEARRRHAQAAEPRRDLQPGAAPHDDRHDADVRDGVRRGVRRHSADAAHRPRASPKWRRCRVRSSSRRPPAVQWWQEIGGLAGRFVLALLVLAIVSRRSLLRVFQVPGLIVVPLVFWIAPSSDVSTLKIGMFFAGFFTVAQFSFWGNYLPRMYPTHLRGTGEGFAANVGGRMLGTSFAYVTTTLASNMPAAARAARRPRRRSSRRSSTSAASA